jgi:hypothetical protein
LKSPRSQPTGEVTATAEGLQGGATVVTDINLSLDDRFLYVSCWGTGEFIQYDVYPTNPKKTAQSISVA